MDTKKTLLLGVLGSCLGLQASLASVGAVAINGQVVITKALTKKRVTMPAYDFRGMSVNGQAPADPNNANSEPNELSWVVVYLEGNGLSPGAPVNATLKQENRRFDPEMVVVTVGSTVSFPNADPIFHNVFSLSKIKKFDLGYYPAGQTRAVKFDRPGVVQVYCHLHADMNAAILVLPTATWTRPAKDGSFSLTGVPAGTYDLVAWHRAAGFFRQPVSVGKEALSVNFVIPLAKAEREVVSCGRGGR